MSPNRWWTVQYAIGHRIHAAIHAINSREVFLSSCLVQNDIETLLAEILSEGTTRMRTERRQCSKWPLRRRMIMCLVISMVSERYREIASPRQDCRTPRKCIALPAVTAPD